MRLAFDKKFLLGLLVGVVLLLGVVWLGQRAITQLRETLDTSSHTQDVLIKLGDLRVSLLDLETGQRGYLLTGEARYLGPYRTAGQRIDGQLAELKRLSTDNAAQRQSLARLLALIAQKRAELQQTIDLRESRGADAALAVVRSDRGKQVMDAIRELLDGMEGEALRTLEQRKAAERQNYRQRLLTGAALALLSAGLLSLIYLLLRRELAARSRSAQTMAQSETQLQRRVQERSQALRETTAALQDEVGARRQVENALELSEGRYRRFLEICPDAVWLNRGGKLAYINPAGLALLGAGTPEQVLGKSPLDFTHPDYQELVRERIEQARTTGGILPIIEQRLIRFDGGVRDVQVAAAGFQEHDGTAILAVVRDITARKQAEKELSETQRLSKLAAEAARMGFWHLEVATDRLDCSEEFLAILGIERAALTSGANALEALVHPEDIERRRRARAEAIAQGRLMDLEFRIRRPDGKLRWMHSRGDFVRDSDGTPSHFYGVILDITERKIAEQALKESEERYRSLVELNPDAVIVNQDGRIAFVNPAALRLYKASSREEMIGKPAFDLVHPSFREASRARLEKVLDEGGTAPLAETQAMCLDGSTRDIEVTASRVFYHGRPAIQSIHRDISARKRAEGLLRDSHAQVRALVHELESTREQERQSLARELHDEFGQLLAALRIDTSWIRRKTQDIAPQIAARAEAMAEVIARAQHATKRLASELRPKVLDDTGLVPALRALVDEFSERHAITCELHISDGNADITDPLATPLYRMTQEALTNIAKHAQATHVRVELVSGDESVTLIFADNGRGLTQGDRRKPGSFGLIGMQERVAALGGKLSISETAGGGVTIEICLPLQARTPRVEAEIEATQH